MRNWGLSTSGERSTYFVYKVHCPLIKCSRIASGVYCAAFDAVRTAAKRHRVFRQCQDVGTHEGYQMNLIHFINEDNIIDTQMQTAGGTIDNTVEPVYDHCTWMKDHVRPLWKHDDYRAISVFWDIGSVKANCLIDNGCKRVMISPKLTRAPKIKTFALEKPIGI